jgi:hypothetical protein
MKIQFNTAAKTALLATFLATGACNVLTQEPLTAFSTADTFSNADRIGKAAIGMYNSLQDLEFYGGRVLIYGDVRSDDTDPSANFPGITDFTALSNTGNVLNAWTGGYRTIYAANLFMQNLAANPNIIDAATTNRYMGEAKFIRAICLFQLCNLYAQPYGFTTDASHLGVPIVLTAAPDAVAAFSATQQIPRSSVKDVYAQIEKDLTEAAAALPAKTGTTATYENTARATKAAAEAMLMRLYLYKGDYSNALLRANNIAATGAYALNANPVTTFRTYPTPESIFTVAMNINDNPNTNNALGQHYFAGGRADITITPYTTALSSLVAADDKRRVSASYTAATGIPATLVATKPASPTAPYTNKYTSVADWVPVTRYPEVLLTQAETLVLTTNTVNATAVASLNTVRERSRVSGTAYTTASFATAADLLTAIRNERRVELAFEGLRYYDLLRYKQTIPARGTAAAVPYGDPKIVLPIPFIETQSNPNLVQNPGY